MKFKLPIGDWSGDGHGKCEYYIVEGNLKDTTALDNAMSVLEKEGVSPRHICQGYEDTSISLEMANKIAAYVGVGSFCEVLDYEGTYAEEVEKSAQADKGYYMDDGGPDGMAYLTLTLLNKADPSLELKLIEDKVKLWLPPYHIGYGLFY